MFKIGKLKEAKIDNFKVKQLEKEFYFEINGKDENDSYFMELFLNMSIDDILRIDNNITKDFQFSICYDEMGPHEINNSTLKLTKYIDDRYLIYISYVDEDISGVVELEVDFSKFK